jgi:ESCRT-II complex subunit VPS22
LCYENIFVQGVSDFYYELAVQIIEICNSMQDRTGGLVYLDQVLEKVLKVRSRFVNEVSLDDCRRAIKKLDIFGSAFTLVPMNNGRFMVQSLPDGMNNDHTIILKLAESNNGVVTQQIIVNELKWDSLRVENMLNLMLKEGIVWLDSYDYKNNGQLKQSYYFPSLFTPVYAS